MLLLHMDFFVVFMNYSAISDELVPNWDKFSSRSAYSRDGRLTIDGYEISHARRDESFSNWSKKTHERMQNQTRRGVRRTNYRKITRQSILSSVARTKKAGRANQAKIYIERFSWSPPPLSPSWCGRRPAAPNGVTLKKRRATEIIPDNHHYMQRPAQSSTQYRQRDATVAAVRDGRSLWKRERRELRRLCENFRAKFRMTWEAQGIYDMRINRAKSK